jgi:P-type Mg2+ transporter
VPARITGAARPRRRANVGANTLRYHRAMPLGVLIGQFSSPLLILFIITASLSYVLGQRIDAVIIGLILAASAGLHGSATAPRRPALGP